VVLLAWQKCPGCKGKTTIFNVTTQLDAGCMSEPWTAHDMCIVEVYDAAQEQTTKHACSTNFCTVENELCAYGGIFDNNLMIEGHKHEVNNTQNPTPVLLLCMAQVSMHARCYTARCRRPCMSMRSTDVVLFAYVLYLWHECTSLNIPVHR
jgi:hypothetical protein